MLTAVIVNLLHLGPLQAEVLGGEIFTIYVNDVEVLVCAVCSQVLLLHFEGATFPLLIGTDPAV
ncbi:MAG: hypothetical protein J6X89_04945 [Bacteroidales bacterium]|nr:hypothetical protein [Bacteroidales bacterium]